MIQDIADMVLETATDQLGEEVTSSSHLVSDLKCDELDAVELVMALEEKMDVEIPDHVADHWLEGDMSIGEITEQVKDL